MRMHLTELAVRKLSNPERKQVTYWDESTSGFGIRVSPKSKAFVIMYGKDRRLRTLGRYPDISLAQARQAAKLELSLVIARPNNMTIPISYSDAVQGYLRECETRLRPSTVGAYRLYLKKLDISGPLQKVSRSQLLFEINKLKSPSTQNYAFTAAKAFLGWAAQNEFVEHNPLGPLKKPNTLQSRDRVLNEDELKIVLEHTLGNRSRFNDIVSLLALTGQRRGEISRLTWSDMEGSTLTVRSENSKNKKPHTIPLGRRSQHLLKTADGGETYVFAEPGTDSPFSGWSKSKLRLAKELDLPNFTLHDLRRTFATTHAKIGTPIHVTEKLLNHVSGTISGIAAVYNRHSYEQEMQAAMTAFDEYVENLLNS